MKRWFLILVTLATIAAAETAEAQDAADPWMTRISARHVAGAGVGHTSGYSSLDWFLPLSPAESDSTMWFSDFRGLIFNDGEFGSNVGTGYRWFVEDQNRIYGVNGYWDTRNSDKLLFNQAGIGVESLGQIFDFRANGYTPAVDDTYHRGDAFFFSGNGLFLPTTSALSGMDAEAGINLPTFYQISTSLFGGGYYYDSNHTIAAAGWRFRAEAAWRDSVVVGVSVQDDELFGQTVNGMIELRHTVFHHATPARRSMRHKFRDADGVGDGATVRHRLADPVYRRQNIVLKNEGFRLTTPGGTSLNFVHVVPGGAGPGTFENPYGSISNAMLNPLSATGYVYTPSGGTFTGNVTMTEGSRLFSNGPTQFVSTNVGSVQLPFSGVNNSLTALPSTIVGDVTLANNTVLNGFDVQGGISGTSVMGVSLVNNRIASSPTDAISLTSSSGVSMNNLLIANPAERGILLKNSSASLSSVTIQDSGITALEINTTDTNEHKVTATGLNITGGLSGIDANVIGAGNLVLNISGTPGSATASNSISVQQDAVNVSTAALSAGNATVQLNSLTVASSAGSGIVVDGSAGDGTTTVTGFSGNSVTKAATKGVLFDTVKFDSNMTTPGIQPVSAGTLTIGAVPGDVTGAGVSIRNSTGNLNLGVAKIFNNNGAGLFVANSPKLTVSSTTGSTVETQFGPVLDLSKTKTALNFTSLKSQNSLNDGIHLYNVTGTINSTTTDIVDSTCDGVSIQSSRGNVNLGVAKIFNNNGPGLFVANSSNLTVSTTTGSTVETQFGPVLDLSNTKTALNFTSLKSENSPVANYGIHLNNVTGTINSTTTDIVDSKGDGVSIENSTGNVNLGVAKIFNSNGPGLFVANSSNLTVSSTTGSTAETQFGPVLDLSNTKTVLNFTSLKSQNSLGVKHGIHLNNVTGAINSTTTTIVDSGDPAAILIENIPFVENSLTPKFGTLTIESLFSGTEATNISLPDVNTGIVQPIYTAPLTIVFP